MAKNYSHSVVFDALKATQEKISDNYTSLQYLQTLDLFLWRALEPIYQECPVFFENYLAKIVANQALKASTKVTSGDRSRLPIHLFNFITEPNPEKAFEHAKSLSINRGILFGLIAIFLRLLKHYEQLNSPFYDIPDVIRRSRMHNIEQQIGARKGGSLYGAIHQVKYWEAKARDWRSRIIEKYTRMTIMQAKVTYQDYNHYVDLDDVVQVYMSVMTRAIDRCDARQGVLTTFIQNWLKSARSEVGELAKGQTDQSYESLLDDHGDAITDILGTTRADNSLELYEELARVAKEVDPAGIVRSQLHIPDLLSREQLSLLRLLKANGTTDESDEQSGGHGVTDHWPLAQSA